MVIVVLLGMIKYLLFFPEFNKYFGKLPNTLVDKNDAVRFDTSFSATLYGDSVTSNGTKRIKRLFNNPKHYEVEPDGN